MQIVNKITMKVIFGEVKDLVIKDDQIDILQIIGVAKTKEQFKSIFGGKESLSWCLHGTFKAQNIRTKEQYYSNRCFLPEIAANLIADQIEGDDNIVQFAFILGVKYSKAPIGYEYTVKSLVKPVENDMIASMEKQIAGALPAPKSDVPLQAPLYDLGSGQAGGEVKPGSLEDFQNQDIK